MVQTARSGKSRLKRPSVAELVKNYIKEHIVNENLKPGDALPVEGRMAEELGVSRGSIREAVRSLESLGILEVRHGNGLFVRGLNLDAVLDVFSFSLMLDPRGLWDLYRMRRLWESSLMPEVVSRIQDADLDECREILSEWGRCLKEGGPFREQDRLFHQALYRTIGNNLLLKLADVFWLAYTNAETRILTLDRAQMSESEMRRNFSNHQKILQAVISRDGDLAQRLMSDHYEGIRRRLMQAMKSDIIPKSTAD